MHRWYHYLPRKNKNYKRKSIFKRYKTKKVVSPNSLSNIEKHAFEGCTYLEELEFEESDNPLIIDNFAFNYTRLSKVFTLPKNTYKVGYQAFTHTDIQTLIIPDYLCILDDIGPDSKIKNIVCNTKKLNKNLLEVLNLYKENYGINIIEKNLDYLLKSSTSFSEINKIYKDLER